MNEPFTITVAGESARVTVGRDHRGAFVKPCPSCHQVAGEELITDPPLLNFPYWWRCRCGNIWALIDQGLTSVPDVKL